MVLKFKHYNFLCTGFLKNFLDENYLIKEHPLNTVHMVTSPFSFVTVCYLLDFHSDFAYDATFQIFQVFLPQEAESRQSLRVRP